MGANSELGSLKNISKDVKEYVILKLIRSASSLFASMNPLRCGGVGAKARRATELEAAERSHSTTKEMLGQVHVPEKLKKIRRVVAKLAPRLMNYAEAAAKPKSMVAAAKTPGPTVRPGISHTLIVESKFENHTAEQVITKLRGVVDARELGVAVDRIRKARGQKVVLNCSPVKDAKK
ncbi:hypothetical protein EVAR_87741_1 [Eumeta japonica]|uniref:Uncharacterized protein n=1 Tax=Eumeta variegata TaxID=151549 RepID=A0A4C1ZPY2_EUMVA|nr:hypothetical protein EVAR_87741_1 [Eumeta japonica]